MFLSNSGIWIMELITYLWSLQITRYNKKYDALHFMIRGSFNKFGSLTKQVILVAHIHRKKQYSLLALKFGLEMGLRLHYDDVIMDAIASQITSLTIVYSSVYSGADQSKHQSSASLAFVWGIHRGPVNSPHKWPVTRKMFPFDDVIMSQGQFGAIYYFWHQLYHRYSNTWH